MSPRHTPMTENSWARVSILRHSHLGQGCVIQFQPAQEEQSDRRRDLLGSSRLTLIGESSTRIKKLEDQMQNLSKQKLDVEEVLSSTKNKMESLEVDNDLLRMKLAGISASKKETEESLGRLQGKLEQSKGCEEALKDH
ncbi:hypothetical protein VNO80_13231 [Phaseolus coccineus]|uniref:Uncharacterized protein n=1 Tax=Phaseolus coccineus TaxID=3886 RepID=A0AAN9N0L4_PHACN